MPPYKHSIYIKPSPIHGYGVFAGKNIKKSEIIEESPVIFTASEQDIINDYVFATDSKQSILALGYGSLYNHSHKPNAECYFDSDKNLFIITAAQFIYKDEEILISYGSEWFKSRDILVKQIPEWQKYLQRLSTQLLRASVVILIAALALITLQIII